MKGMKRAIRPENDGVFLGLAVTEEASKPERTRNLGGVDLVEFVHTDAPAKKLVNDGVGRVHQECAAAKSRRIQPALAKNLIGANLCRLCVDGKFQESPIAGCFTFQVNAAPTIRQ